MSNVVEIDVKADDHASGVLGGLGKVTSALKGKLTEAAAGMARMGLAMGAVVTTGLSAIPVLAPVGVAIYNIGAAAVSAAPALVAFRLAGEFVKFTLKEIFAKGSAAVAVLEPLKTRFTDAGKAASEAAAKGVAPLVEQFNKVAMPHVEQAMVRIGDAVNTVQKGFLKWGASTEGVKAIKGFLDPIGETMNHLAPKVVDVGIAFAKMLGRITGVSMAAGEQGLSGILDKVIGLLDKIDAKSTGGGIEKLKNTFHTIMDVGSKVKDVIGKIVEAYKSYQTHFKAVADAVSVAAIIFGGPVTAIVAAVGLIIRHFGDLKKIGQEVGSYFKSPIGKGVLSDLGESAKKIIPGIRKGFESLKEKALPALKDVIDTVKNDLAPAFADFMKEAGPTIGKIAEALGKLGGEAVKGALEDLKGVLQGIAGAFKFFSGLLSGDVGKMMDGIGLSARGLGNAIKGTLRSMAPGLWDAVAGAVKGVSNAVSGLIGWIRRLVGKTVRIAQTGAQGAMGAVSNLIGTIRRFIGKVVRVGVSGVEGAINAVSRLIGWISNLTGKIVNVGVNIAGGVRDLLGFGSGGIVGAAGGGPRSNLVMVGEQGRELVKLPFGSTVMPHGQTERMVGQSGGGGGRLQIEWVGGNAGDEFMAWLRKNIRIQGGDVQTVLGKG